MSRRTPDNYYNTEYELTLNYLLDGKEKSCSVIGEYFPNNYMISWFMESTFDQYHYRNKNVEFIGFYIEKVVTTYELVEETTL